MTQFMASVAIFVLESIGALTQEKCNAYGGSSLLRDQVRLCDKWRFHTDSHSYDWTDYDGEL